MILVRKLRQEKNEGTTERKKNKKEWKRLTEQLCYYAQIH